MQPGDIVTVRATGRRARIVADAGRGRFQVEYMPDDEGDPLDRDTVQSQDESGIYSEADLEPFE